MSQSIEKGPSQYKTKELAFCCNCSHTWNYFFDLHLVNMQIKDVLMGHWALVCFLLLVKPSPWHRHPSTKKNVQASAACLTNSLVVFQWILWCNCLQPKKNNLPSCERSHILPRTNSSHLKIDPCKRRFLLETTIFRCYVSFRECIPYNRRHFFESMICRFSRLVGYVTVVPWEGILKTYFVICCLVGHHDLPE